jgi:hypothetical protein
MSKLIQQLYKFALLVSLAGCSATSAPLPTLAKLPTEGVPVELTATTQRQQKLPPSWTPEPSRTTAPTATRRPSTNTPISTQVSFPTRRPTKAPTLNSSTESDVGIAGSITESSGSPADAAKTFFLDTWAGKNVASSMCTSNPAGAQTVKQGLVQLTNTLQGKATIDGSGLKFKTSSQSGNSAQVKLTGKFTLIVPGHTDATLQFSETTINMKNEGGSWKVCGASW